MARSENPLPSEEIKISFNVQMIWYLDQMIEMGFFGSTRQEVIKSIVSKKCEELTENGRMENLPKHLRELRKLSSKDQDGE